MTQKSTQFVVEPKHLFPGNSGNLLEILAETSQIDTLIVSRRALNTNRPFLIEAIKKAPRILYVNKNGKGRADIPRISKLLKARRKRLSGHLRPTT